MIELPDSIIKFVGLTNVNGGIIIPDTLENKSSNSILSIRSFGFIPEMNIQCSHINDTISLRPEIVSLNEFVIKEYKPSLKREVGKFIYDPSELKKEMVNCFDVLKFTPLVNTSESGISILGKGSSKIYINGKAPLMSQREVIDMLKGTSPSQIKRIEIITEPGTTVAANTSGGIVNVVLSQPNQGYRGSISTNVKYEAERISPRISFWNGYAMGKFKASMNLSYQGVNRNYERKSDYLYKEDSKTVSNYIKTKGWSNYLSGNINATYNFTQKSMLGASASLSASGSHENSYINTEINNQRDNSEYYIKSQNPFSRPTFGLRGFYEIYFGRNNNKFEIVADYYSNLSNSEIKYIFNPEILFQNTKINSQGVHAKAQSSIKFTPLQNLQFGYDFFKSNIDYISSDNSSIKNNFKYNESINSCFIEWRSLWSTLFSTNIGMRLETAHLKGNQTSLLERFGNTKTDIFPTLGFSFNIPRGYQNISIDLGRRILRPYYDYLNPYIIWSSENTYRVGNPHLQPEYLWNTGLYYSFLRSFVLGGMFIYTTDCISEYTYQKDGNTITSYINGGNQKLTNFFFSYNKTFGNVWRIKADADIAILNRKLWLDNNNLGFKSIQWSFSILNSVVLSQKYKVKMMISYSLNSPVKMVTAFGKWKNLLDLSFTKTFGKNVTLSLEAYNLLNFKNDYHFEDVNYGYSHKSKYSTRAISLNFTCLFGKTKVSAAEDRSNTALEQRIKKSN